MPIKISYENYKSKLLNNTLEKVYNGNCKCFADYINLLSIDAIKTSNDAIHAVQCNDYTIVFNNNTFTLTKEDNKRNDYMQFKNYLIHYIENHHKAIYLNIYKIIGD